MRDSKKRLIHAAFQVARAMNLKVQMNEYDYKKFYESCQVDSEYNGAEYTKTLVVHGHTDACKARSLHLDYNPIYGGYRLDQYCNNSGGMSFFLNSERHKAETLADLLNSFCRGVSVARQEKEEAMA